MHPVASYKKVSESIFGILLCVQIRQICSAGDSPVRVKARNPVA
ncbi:MAG: hypothetical protein ACYDIA_20815 [Candidatus Humimicrobiaceae bacterium]